MFSSFYFPLFLHISLVSSLTFLFVLYTSVFPTSLLISFSIHLIQFIYLHTASNSTEVIKLRSVRS